MHTRPGGCDSGCGESDKVKKRNYVPFFNTRLYHSLRRLSSMPRYLPVCEGMIPTESRMREIRTSGSTSGGWNRVYGRRSKHRRESVWRTPRTLRAPRQPSTLPLFYRRCGCGFVPEWGVHLSRGSKGARTE